MFYIRSLEEFCASNKIDDAKRDAGLTTPEDVRRFDNIRYGEHDRHLLDVYRPKDADGKLPIVSIHGGGWVYGDKELMQFYCMSLAEHGFAMVNFSYRIAPEYNGSSYNGASTNLSAFNSAIRLTASVAMSYAKKTGEDTYEAIQGAPTDVGDYKAIATVSGTKTLDLNGHILRASDSKKFSVIIVPANTTLNLSDSGTTTHKFKINNPTNGAGLATVDDASGTKSFAGGYITGGSAGQGGGVCINGGTFTMSGGTISYNTSVGRGAGLAINKTANTPNVTLSDTAEVLYNTTSEWGSGISNFGNLTITGSVQVKYNVGTGDASSGVHLQDGTFKLSGSPVINDNEVAHGNIHLSTKSRSAIRTESNLSFSTKKIPPHGGIFYGHCGMLGFGCATLLPCCAGAGAG